MNRTELNQEIDRIAKNVSKGLARWKDDRSGLIRRANAAINFELEGRCENQAAQGHMVSHVFSSLYRMDYRAYRRMFPLVQMNEAGVQYVVEFEDEQKLN